MVCGGVSVKGSYHNINQDNYICKPYKDGFVMVVSDGMGSKKYSEYGSKAICESVFEVIDNLDFEIDILNFKDILYECHEKWKRKLLDFELNQCYATMLVVIVMDKKLKMARLGDGFVSVYIDNQVICLLDEKEDYFANETDCLSEIFDRNKIEIYECGFDVFHGAIACTDGIEIGTMQKSEIQNFTREFLDEYCGKCFYDINKEIEVWVSEWSGADDKTISYMIGRDISE